MRIPNEEIRLEFAKAIRQVKRDDTLRRVRESEQLIADTVHGKEEALAGKRQHHCRIERFEGNG